MFLEPNDLLNQVNEQEEDQNIDDADQILEDLANAVNLEHQPVQVDLPHLEGPAENFLHHEIQENELMNDEELQQQDHENMNQNVPNGHHNLQFGLVLTSFHNRPVPDSYLNWEGAWAKFFKPALGSVPHSLIPMDWVSFFSAVLLSPNHFEKAKNLLKDKNLLKAISNDQCVGFNIPEKCPTSASRPSCTLTELDQELSALEQDQKLPTLVQEVTDIDPSEAPPVEKEPKKVRGKTIIVESELRRSPRIQESKKGFHNPFCKAKQCLGCSSAPPTLSSKVIRNLCSSLCDVDASLLGDEALKKKRRTEAPIGSKNLKKQPSVENADKTKIGAEKQKTGADDKINEVAERKKAGGSKIKTSKKKPAPKDAGHPTPPEEEGPNEE